MSYAKNAAIRTYGNSNTRPYNVNPGHYVRRFNAEGKAEYLALNDAWVASAYDARCWLDIDKARIEAKRFEGAWAS